MFARQPQHFGRFLRLDMAPAALAPRSVMGCGCSSRRARHKNRNLPQTRLDNRQNRENVAHQLIESFGGKLHQLFFAFGEYDIVAISVFPDNESATAAAFSLTASGAFARAHTTVLMTPAEAVRSLTRVSTTKASYRPPAG